MRPRPIPFAIALLACGCPRSGPIPCHSANNCPIGTVCGATNTCVSGPPVEGGGREAVPSVTFAVLGSNADGRLYGGSEPSQQQATDDRTAARNDYAATWVFLRSGNSETDRKMSVIAAPGGAAVSLTGRF